MKKVLLILSVFLALCGTAGAQEIMYVTSPEGLRVRSEPSLSAKKIDSLYFGETVLVDKIGPEATIDGIKSNWIKVKFYDDEQFPDKNGWVFGGYLSQWQPEMDADAFEFIKSYFKRSGKDYFWASYFPDEYRTVYFRDDENWNQHPTYYSTLENLCQKDYYPDHEAVTIRECMYYEPPQAPCKVGTIRILPADTKITLYETDQYCEKGGVLFPIYKFEAAYKFSYETGYIRGIDITSTNHTASVSDGEGGKYTLYYQKALKHVNSSNYGYSKDKIKEVLDTVWTYEGAYLKGGFEMNTVIITDPDNRSYVVEDFDTDAISLELEYPLNMKTPVLFIKANLFSGGMGGGFNSTQVYTAELYYDTAKVRNAFEYGYLSVDAGYDGMAYHYYTDNGAVVYEYQTDEMGNVERNRYNYHIQKPSSPYVFWEGGDYINGEPEGKSQTFKKGQYVNPICRLKMRVSPSLNSMSFLTLNPGTLLKITEIGDRTTIDGIKSNWVKVEPVNDDKSVEGYVVKNWLPGEETSAWVFGGYLE